MKPGSEVTLGTWNHEPPTGLGYTIPIPVEVVGPARFHPAQTVVRALRADGTWTFGIRVPSDEVTHEH